jgi:hypothetical protein
VTTLSLFYDCPLPGCKNPVGHPAEPCGECAVIFGEHLRPTGEERPAEAVAAELAERDTYVAAILAARRDGWLSPVCVITPRKYRNHTACDYVLCTCGCHRRKEAAVIAAGTETTDA